MAAAAAKPKEKGKLEIQGFQIEVETEIQWRSLLRREGLIIVDVYASWAGPCISMVNIFKRLKVEVNDDRLWLAIACSDNIDDLLMFKDQSEPAWLFIGGGKPVKMFRGSNVPKLLALIKQELDHELACIAGKARRNLVVSIDDEDSRRKKTEAEAARLQKMIKEEDINTGEELNVLRKESSTRLMSAMELYTVLAIQNFVIETGYVNEIKDYLLGDFKIEQERHVSLFDDGIRNLFRIPYELLDPNEPADFGYQAEGEQNEDQDFQNRDDDEPTGDNDDSENPKPVKKSKRKTIPVEIPEGVQGETLIMVLECVDLRKMMDSGKKPPPSSLLQTADDYIQLKVGPKSYDEAVEHAPYSLHAVYGKGNYAPGVWCPRNYDDKRYTMINFFPRFVTEVLMPKSSTEPKYMLAVYPASMAKEVMENADVASQTKDILAQGTTKIPPALADEMLKSWHVEGDLLARKKALTSGQVFALSVNKRNSTLKLAIHGLKPLHTSYDNTYGKLETAHLFQQLNIDVTNLPDPDETVQKFLARSGPRILPVYVEEDIPPPQTGGSEGDDEDEGSGSGTRETPPSDAPKVTATTPATPASGDEPQSAPPTQPTTAPEEEKKSVPPPEPEPEIKKEDEEEEEGSPEDYEDDEEDDEEE